MLKGVSNFLFFELLFLSSSKYGQFGLNRLLNYRPQGFTPEVNYAPEKEGKGGEYFRK